MDEVIKIVFTTSYERINAYESENVYVAVISYEDGRKLRFKDLDRQSLIEKVKERIK